MNRADVLPDVLRPSLITVFCGSAVGFTSAKVRAYYARAGNRFWHILHEAGFTDRCLSPGEYPQVLSYGLGLTDLAKREFGNDSDLSRNAYRPDALREKLERFRPRFLAFTAKTPARAFLRDVFGATLPTGPEGYGSQPQVVGETRLWVLPSTSGRAQTFWDPKPWHTLAELHRAERERVPPS